MTTLREHSGPGDQAQLTHIAQEYDYLLSQKFSLMEQRDGLLASRSSIVDVTRQIGQLTGRLQYLDTRRHTIACLPDQAVTAIEPGQTEPARPYMHMDWREPLTALTASRGRGLTPDARTMHLVSIEQVREACLEACGVTLADACAMGYREHPGKLCKRLIFFFCYSCTGATMHEIAAQALPGREINVTTALGYRDKIRSIIHRRQEPEMALLRQIGSQLGYDVDKCISY